MTISAARLAVKGKILGRKVLEEIGTLFTPDTILRWHRELVAKKWDYSDRRPQRPGRPRLADEVAQLIVQLARENPTWGYDRLQGALANLGHQVSDQTIGNILKAQGIEPRPSANGRPPGRPSSGPTGMYWRPSISRRSRSGPGAA